MLILVAVSVTVALNGGLFSTAKQATEGTEVERDKELALSGGQVEIGGLVYGSIEDYRAGNLKLPDNTEQTTKETEQNETIKTLIANWDLSKVTAVKVLKEDGTLDGTIPLPKGFQISLEDGENTVTEGLVITDGANEFVWIPVTNAEAYTEESFEPLTYTDSESTYVYDSQEELDYYYGPNYYNYSDFTYATDKTNVEESIQIYGGFYVGRYETTIDGTTIGVQAGKTILTVATLLKEGTNEASNDEYHYRWWGLYKAQKDMYANNQSVGSLMISSKQWDAIMTFTGYGDTKRGTDTYTTKPDLSGSAYTTDATKYDVSKNIYDLAGNVLEFTLKANNTGAIGRGARGSCYFASISSSFKGGSNPVNSSAGTRF